MMEGSAYYTPMCELYMINYGKLKNMSIIMQTAVCGKNLKYVYINWKKWVWFVKKILYSYRQIIKL